MKWIPFNQWAILPADQLRDLYWEAMELVSFKDGTKEIRAQFEGLKSTGKKVEDAKIAHDAILAALYCCADLADDQGDDVEADDLRERLEEIDRRGIPMVKIYLAKEAEKRFQPLFQRSTRESKIEEQWDRRMRRYRNQKDK